MKCLCEVHQILFTVKGTEFFLYVHDKQMPCENDGWLDHLIQSHESSLTTHKVTQYIHVYAP